MAGYDLIVVGGGPGGYPGAILAARKGMNVLLVEENLVGGECTNYGCIPTKALLASVKYSLGSMLASRERSPPSVEKTFEEAQRAADEVRSGLEGLLESNGVRVERATARLSPGGSVEVNGVRHDARRILLASGSSPLVPPSWRVPGVVDNRSILSGTLDMEPGERIVIVGGGPVGVEYAQVMAGLGFETVLIEALPRLLPGLDRDLGLLSRRMLSRLGVRVYTGKRVEKVSAANDERVMVALEGGETVTASIVLAAIGRVPRSEEAVRAGAEVDERGFVSVDECGRASLSWLWAAGDVAGPPLLAHKAIVESKRVVECEPRFSGRVIPYVVYGYLDIVSVGYTLEEAAELGFSAVEARVGAAWTATSRIHHVKEGIVKIVYDESNGRILGVHMAFPGASEAAGEASMIVSLGLTLEEVASTVHPHPTAVEALLEAVEAVLGESVHIVRARVRKG